MFRQLLALCVSVFLLFSSFAWCTSETLPKGVWSFNTWYLDHEFDRVAVEKDGKIQFVKATGFTANFVPSLKTLFGIAGQDLNTPIADTFEINETNFQLSYGVTDKLTVFAETQFVDRVLKYTDEYIAAAEFIENNVTPLMLVPPKTAQGHGWGDSMLGVKYRFRKNTAVAFSAIAGFLKTGTDPLEKNVSVDGYEELPTGHKNDRFYFSGFQSFDLSKKTRLNLSAIYLYHAPGDWTEAFGDSFAYDPGDEFIGTAHLAYAAHKKLDLGTKLIIQTIDHDKTQAVPGGTYTPVKNSNSQLHYIAFDLRYKPLIFLHFWSDFIYAFRHDPSLGVYEYPGRLDPSQFARFGVNVFFK